MNAVETTVETKVETEVDTRPVHVWMVWCDKPLRNDANAVRDRLGQFYTAYLFSHEDKEPRMPAGYSRIKKHGVAEDGKLNPMLNAAKPLGRVGVARFRLQDQGPSRAQRRGAK